MVGLEKNNNKGNGCMGVGLKRFEYSVIQGEKIYKKKLLWLNLFYVFKNCF